ncbi:MAG TPA: flagellar hook-basal body complex protein [Gemmatimonadales bacterium]|nr:flagellar hook-basal body complex protein [Gemmatimonadales bacterium]
MMRSLFSAVSGLRNSQTEMDVIGNNIANVNTVAFKSSRVTFSEAFAELLQGASRPPGDLGGINPIQIGLGSKVGSIDQNFAQGTLQSTGGTTDLAIQGDGLFVLSDGSRSYYTRAGNFQLDANGNLVSPANGFKVQGINADSSGRISTGSAITDIALPFGKKSPAKATTSVTLTGNLDSQQQPLGTIMATAGSILAIEKSTSNGGAGSDVANLYASGAANSLISGMVPASTTVTVSDGTTTRNYTYVTQDTGVGKQDFHSLADLVAEVNNDFGATGTNTMTAAQNNATGAIDFTAVSAVNLSISSSNPALLKALSSANGALAAGATGVTDQFSHQATQTDLLTDLRNGSGVSLGLAAGNTITVDGTKGTSAVPQGNLAVGAATTYGQLLTAVNTTLGLTNISAAQIDPTTGALVINADGGTVNALSAINIQSSGAGAAQFNSLFDSRPGNYQQLQAATDVTHEAAITVYDAIGTPISLSMTFTKDPTASNRWLWSASVPQPAAVTGGGSGAVTFDSDGHLQTFSYNGGASSLQFDPGTGASPVDINLDGGKLGDINGLSQFASASNAVASNQDGYPMGNLQDISVDSRGVITGYFSNGVNQTLAQIAMASFNNPSGLLQAGNNMYSGSANSGQAIIGFSGTSNQSTITPGALENSNVDLSQEFTNMIIAQRGFQANAKVIQTSDEMLQTLVGLKQ